MAAPATSARLRLPQDILPPELWRRVAEYIRKDEWKCASEQWQAANTGVGVPLRQFSQSCTLFRDVSLPLLWRSVTLRTSTYADARLALVRQLNVALTDPRIAREVHHVAILLDDEAVYSLFDEGEVDGWRRNASQELQRYFSTLQDFYDALNVLAKRLRRCPELQSFMWQGEYRPINPFYNDLARAPSLRRIALDYGDFYFSACADDENSELRQSKGRDAEDFADFAICISQADLAFGDNFDGVVYGDMRHCCRGLYAWMTAPNQIHTLRLAAPMLSRQPWMVPMWAQASVKDHPDHVRGALCYLPEGREDVDAPFVYAAEVFRSILTNLCQRKQEEASGSDATDLSPEDVLALIHEHADLRVWRDWFPSLDDEETKTVMQRIVDFKKRGDSFGNASAYSDEARALIDYTL